MWLAAIFNLGKIRDEKPKVDRRVLTIIVLLLSGSPALADIELRVADVVASPGKKVIVPIMARDGGDLSAIQFDLNFNPNLLSLAGGGSVLTGDLCREHSILTRVTGSTMTVAIISASLSGMKSGTGTVVQLIFDTSPLASHDSVGLLRLSGIKAADLEGKPIPASGLNGSVIFGSGFNRPFLSQNEIVFPQIANGEIPDNGRFLTIALLVNQSQVQASAHLEYYRQDGTPFPLQMTNGLQGSSFDVSIDPLGSYMLQTDGRGPLSIGYLRVSSTVPVGGAILFGWRDESGRLITEAGVPQSPVSQRVSVPILYEKDRSSSGVVLVNLSGEPFELSIELRESLGTSMGMTVVELDAGEQKALFVHEEGLFPEVMPLQSFLGWMQISAPGPVAVTAMKQAVTEGLITNFPILIQP